MEKYILKRGNWYDDQGPELLIYFTIFLGEKKIWRSGWHDLAEFCEEPNLVNEFRKQLATVCRNYKIEVDLSSESPCDWEQIEIGENNAKN
jgi:hypothetical protein